MTPLLTDVWEFGLHLSGGGEMAIRAGAVIDGLRCVRTVGDVGPTEWRVIYPYFESHELALDALHRELDSIDPDWRDLVLTD